MNPEMPPARGSGHPERLSASQARRKLILGFDFLQAQQTDGPR